ncbi:MAG: DUF4412 domain-containing protein [Flavobacteriaceae bacterium]|nr:DUF4412 domain-containing protein [Flavobacteriaceae bacterium]
MNFLKIILLSIVLSISFTNEANAQFLKKLQKRVQQAAEDAIIDKAAEKAEQEAEKAMDSLLNIDSNYQAKDSEQLLNSFIQSGENVEIEEVYTFNTNVIMQMIVEDEKGPTIIDYSMWFTNSDSYMATEIQNMDSKKSKSEKIPKGILTVIDDENQAMVILMEEQKMAQTISMESIKNIAIEEVENKNSTPSKIIKTGRSKKILGYHCEEFESTTEEGKMTLWITQDIRLFQKNMFANFNKSLDNNPFQNIPEAAKGFMMEMHFNNANNEEKSSMIVKEISKKNKTIHIKDYQLMNLSGFMKN